MAWVDWLAFVSGVVCVYLIVRERDVNWPIGLVCSGALLVMFVREKLYAQVLLQAFYIVECAYGWWMWTRRDGRTGLKVVRIGKTKGETMTLLAGMTVGLGVVFALVFRATGDPAPVTDSVIVALSLVAEYMLCLKLLEAWGVYLVADLIALALFAWLGAWWLFATYLCYTGLCVMGVVEWGRRWRMGRSEGAGMVAAAAGGSGG